MNWFATTTSGNIHFSDVLMVFTNTHYTLWLTIPWSSTKINFIKWKRMNKKWHWKNKSMFWCLNVSFYLLFKIMHFHYKLVFSNIIRQACVYRKCSDLDNLSANVTSWPSFAEIKLFAESYQGNICNCEYTKVYPTSSL